MRAAWLIAFSLAAFQLFGQQQEPAGIEGRAAYWEISQNKPSVVHQGTYVVGKAGCPLSMPDPIEDKCVYDWKGFEPKVAPVDDGDFIEVAPPVQKRGRYVYNFTGHISVSMAPKLSEMSLSKLRIEYEKDLKSEHFTAGALLSMYTLEYYYRGYRLEGFSRFYFVPNTSGDGAFVQARIGWGRFWGGPGPSFGGAGLGVDIGSKFIAIGNKRDFRNSFTVTPMGGIQAYPGPDGSIPVSWVWQLRFGYQF
jgi:hypothetical protein